MAGRVALGPSSLPENALTSSRLESGRLRRKRAIDESCQDRSRVEIVAGEREGRCGMPLRFRGHPRDRLRRLVDGAECQHAEPSRNMPYESRILDDGGDAQGQIACGPARKPTRASRDVRVLRHAPLSERARQIRSIGPRVARHCVRVDDAPAVPLEAFDRAGTAEGDLERQSAAGGERDETLEFVPLAAIGDTTDHGPMAVLLPRRDGRQRTASRTDGPRVTPKQSSTMGWRVVIQEMSCGMRHSGAPKFSPKVKNTWCRRKVLLCQLARSSGVPPPRCG